MIDMVAALLCDPHITVAQQEPAVEDGEEQPYGAKVVIPYTTDDDEFPWCVVKS